MEKQSQETIISNRYTVSKSGNFVIFQRVLSSHTYSGVVRGVQAGFFENPGKIPENLGKIPENPGEIPKYLGKIP